MTIELTNTTRQYYEPMERKIAVRRRMRGAVASEVSIAASLAAKMTSGHPAFVPVAEEGNRLRDPFPAHGRGCRARTGLEAYFLIGPLPAPPVLLVPVEPWPSSLAATPGVPGATGCASLKPSGIGNSPAASGAVGL